MNFTDDELKLIMRALNTYKRILAIPTLRGPDGSTEPDDADELATRIYRENFRI